MFGVATTMPTEELPSETETVEPMLTSTAQTTETAVTHTDLDEAEAEAEATQDNLIDAIDDESESSPLNYFLFGFIAFLIGSCVFVWLGGARCLKRIVGRPFKGKYVRVASEADPVDPEK